jgi:hypothetical protein
MSLAEIEAALGEPLILLSDDPDQPCTQYRLASVEGVHFVMIDGGLAFISAVGLATEAGVGTGSAEAEIEAAYVGDDVENGRSRLAVRQVVVRPASGEPLATLFRMATTGDQGKVEVVKVGNYPTVEQYDEGCP